MLLHRREYTYAIESTVQYRLLVNAIHGQSDATGNRLAPLQNNQGHGHTPSTGKSFQRQWRGMANMSGIIEASAPHCTSK